MGQEVLGQEVGNHTEVYRATTRENRGGVQEVDQTIYLADAAQSSDISCQRLRPYSILQAAHVFIDLLCRAQRPGSTSLLRFVSGCCCNLGELYFFAK